jgi:hypothetical protein
VGGSASKKYSCHQPPTSNQINSASGTLLLLVLGRQVTSTLRLEQTSFKGIANTRHINTCNSRHLWIRRNLLHTLRDSLRAGAFLGLIVGGHMHFKWGRRLSAAAVGDNYSSHIDSDIVPHTAIVPNSALSMSTCISDKQSKAITLQYVSCIVMSNLRVTTTFTKHRTPSGEACKPCSKGLCLPGATIGI